ncbi:hypothetical protein [Nostoc sp.]|uniref:CRISPR-associated endonuclease Cas2 n=1 Tax=Nostoc sp. TaxID=1180 RepID=UPI003FA59B71
MILNLTNPSVFFLVVRNPGKLRSRLAKLIKPDTDSVRFYFLCGCCQRKVERIGGEQPRDETIFFAESPSS